MSVNRGRPLRGDNGVAIAEGVLSDGGNALLVVSTSICVGAHDELTSSSSANRTAASNASREQLAAVSGAPSCNRETAHRAAPWRSARWRRRMGSERRFLHDEANRLAARYAVALRWSGVRALYEHRWR